MTVLALHGLSIGHGRPLAQGIDAALQPGSVTCLLGPNGVGKTTLIRTLMGLIPALAGRVLVGGADVATLPRRVVARRIAYVPQGYAGDFAYTVLDLVVMGRTAHLGVFASPGRADVDRALAALDTLGIADLAPCEASRISGGQRQLVLIARALAQEAGLVVMDEPTASLDLANRLLVQHRIRALAAAGPAILLSTHEPEQAFALDGTAWTLGPDGFAAGLAASLLDNAALTRLYGVPLRVEATASGRRIVSPR